MKRSGGFTLIEMTVTTAVFTLLMLLVGMILRSGEEQARQSDIKMSLEESARESLARMALEIRESAPAQTAVLNGGNTLSFQIPAAVSNAGTITWSNPILYNVGGNGTQLVRTDTGTGVITVLANDIQNVAFTLNGNPVASVGLTVTARRLMTNNRPITIISTGEARVRNP